MPVRLFPAPVIAAGLILAMALSAGMPSPTVARDGSTMLSIANEYRADAGVSPVSFDRTIDRIAVDRANKLAADERLGHDFDALKRRLAAEGVCWQQLGEIVAYNTAGASDRLERFARQWYDSALHRDIMLGSGYTHAGGSWATGSDGRHYAAMIFVRLCGATPKSTTYGGFTDIADSKFRDDIVWLAQEGITTGCAETRFCPSRLVFRDQMATFLSRAMALPTASKDWFNDDGGNVHHERINRVADARVTYGCDSRMFCPSKEVTRAQMASFIARALDLPPTSRDYFKDDDWSAHEDAINRMAAAGITYGCDADRFCPRASVKREQMAAFLRRAYD